MQDFLFKGIEGGFLQTTYSFILILLIIGAIYTIIGIKDVFSSFLTIDVLKNPVVSKLRKKNFSESEIIKYMKVYYFIDLILFIYCFLGLLTLRFDFIPYILIPTLIPSAILKVLELSIEKNRESL